MWCVASHRTAVIALCAGLVWGLLPTPARSAERPAAGRAYVSNTDEGTVSVVDLGTMTEIGMRIYVGNEPRGSAVTPDGAFVYVACRHSDRVDVIDTATDTLATSIPLTGAEPYNLVITPDGSRVYVVCKWSSTVSVITTASNTETASIALSTTSASPEGVAITPDGAKVYVANRQDGTVDVISTSTNTLIAGPLTVGTAPRDAAVSGDGTKVIVVGEGDPRVIRTSDDTIVATMTASGNQRDVASVGMRAFVTTTYGRTLDEYDLATNTFVRSIPLSGFYAYGVAVDRAGRFVWVTQQDSNNVQTVDLDAGAEVGAPAAVGANPRGISVLTVVRVDSYFLPNVVKLKLKGADKDRLIAGGFFDDGGAPVSYTDPCTIDVGGFSRTFTLTQNKKGTKFTFKGPDLVFTVKPDRNVERGVEGSSRGKFRMKISKATLTGLVPTDGPCDFHFRATGLPDAMWILVTEKGKFKLGRKRGTLTAPAFLPKVLKARVSDTKPDKMRLLGGFATSEAPPAVLRTVRIAVGDTYALEIPGSQFSENKKGGVWKFREKTDGRQVRVVIDFLRERLTVVTKGVEAGDLRGASTDILFDSGSDDAAVVTTVVLSRPSDTVRVY